MARFWILLIFMVLVLSGKVESKKKRKFLVQVKEKVIKENAESGEDYGKDLTLKRTQSLLAPLQTFPRPLEPTWVNYEPHEASFAGSIGQVAGLATIGQVAGQATIGQMAGPASIRGEHLGRPSPQGDTAGQQN